MVNLEINRNGYGFVVINGENLGDVFICSQEYWVPHLMVISLKWNYLLNKKAKILEGQIVRVIERKRKEYVGVIKKSKSFFFISSDDPKIHRDIYINESKLSGAKIGDKVVVGKLVWDSFNA